MDRFVTVARHEDLPELGGLEVIVEGQRLALFKRGLEVFAMEAICPHRGGPLSAGWVENGSVYCPLHGWEFGLANGECRTNTEKSLRAFPARIVDGNVQVDVSRR